jgi:hypothetical protein
MSDIPMKAATQTLLKRARLELAAAAKVVEAAAAGKPIKWEELFAGGGSFGLTDQGCNGNTSCRSNDACK